MEPNNTIWVELSRPLEFNGEKITELELPEPEAGQLKEMDSVDGAIGKSLKLISVLVNLPVAVLEKLPARDFNKLDKAVTDFLMAGR